VSDDGPRGGADRPSKERAYVSYRSQQALHRLVAFVNSP